MHLKLTQIFGSSSKADEILLLLHDRKKVVRHAFYPLEFGKVEHFCKKHNINYTKSNFKVILSDTNKSFSNKGIRVPLSDPQEGLRFVYFSKDELAVHKAHLAEITNNHFELGTLLGYPTCCIEYFSKEFNENNTNPIQNTSNPFINLSKRSVDVVLISHFPCSTNCEKSIDLAKKNLQFLHTNAKNRCNEILNVLNLHFLM